MNCCLKLVRKKTPIDYIHPVKNYHRKKEKRKKKLTWVWKQKQNPVVDAGQPTLYLPPSRKSRPSKDEHAQKQEQQKQQQKTYLFTMVDQSLPWSSLPNTTNFTSLVRGIGQNRTTRLHWFEWNVHAVPATPGHPHLLQLQNCSEPVADYQGPMPPKGDIPHDYVLYLFEQPKGYMPDQGAMARYANESDSFARMNFSIKALVDGIGAPFAANYFRVENENNTIKA
jgi:phosphatidylethanolamine-binding protein (PEBP) family uncharacterized protein